MLTNPIDFARMYLDPRARNGRQFAFLPKLARVEGCDIIEVANETFRQRLFVRPNTTDVDVFHQVFGRRSYDFRSFARWDDIRAAYVPGSSLILDLGAYTGLSTVYFASQWPDAKIVAVEPDEENYATLLKNTGGLSIVALNDAVGLDQWVRIADPASEEWMRTTEPTMEGAPGAVRSWSVPSLLAKYAGQPFIAKIDIEGAERDLFSGDCSWIDTFPVIIVELHDWLFPKARTAQPFLKAIAARNRDILLKENNVFSIRNDG